MVMELVQGGEFFTYLQVSSPSNAPPLGAETARMVERGAGGELAENRASTACRRVIAQTWTGWWACGGWQQQRRQKRSRSWDGVFSGGGCPCSCPAPAPSRPSRLLWTTLSALPPSSSQARETPLSEDEARFYAGCVILGLEYMHDRGVAWRCACCLRCLH